VSPCVESWSSDVCVSVTVRISLSCVSAYYVENLIALVSNCSVQLKVNISAQLLTFYDDFQIIVQH